MGVSLAGPSASRWLDSDKQGIAQMLLAVSVVTAVSVAAADLLVFALLSTAFLTAWWVVSHSVIAD